MRVKISALGLLILLFSDVYFDLDSIFRMPILMFLLSVLISRVSGMRTTLSSVFLALVLPALLFISIYVLSLTALYGNEIVFYISSLAAFFSGSLLGGFRFKD
jgi:hypothetical protein